MFILSWGSRCEGSRANRSSLRFGVQGLGSRISSFRFGFLVVEVQGYAVRLLREECVVGVSEAGW